MSGHGAIRLIEPRCTSCMICARECPAWCITVDAHPEPIPDLLPGARERTRNVLERFSIDWSLCLYCGICIEECPFDALAWREGHALPEARSDLLVHERDRLTADEASSRPTT